MKGKKKKKKIFVCAHLSIISKSTQDGSFSSSNPPAWIPHEKREEIKRTKKYNLWDEGAATVLVALTCLSPWIIMGSDFRLGLLVYFSWMDHQSRVQLASILEKASLWIGLSEIFLLKKFLCQNLFHFLHLCQHLFGFSSQFATVHLSVLLLSWCAPVTRWFSLSVLILSYTTMFMLLSDCFLGCVVNLKYRQLVSLQWQNFRVLIAFYGYLWA